VRGCPLCPDLEETSVPDPASLTYDERGLIPVVVQQHDTGEVLMVAYTDRAGVEESLAGGETVFWSRSRGERWHKGATSGDIQRIVEIRVDCDGDTLLVLVDQRGRGACHTGERSCFGRVLGPEPGTPAARPPAPPRWTDRPAPSPGAGPDHAEPTTEEPTP
jgi:phosphoribosyl-AMP cyclohydrolase